MERINQIKREIKKGKIHKEEITHEKACILLNCEPAISYLESKRKQIEMIVPYFREDKYFNKIKEEIKTLQKKYGIGNYIDPYIISAIAFFKINISLGKKVLKKISKENICKIFNIPLSTFRKKLHLFTRY